MAANYPQSLDTDANLILVSGTDALIPAHHNNTKDAVEAVELSLGAIDNTLGGRVGASFVSPLMHQAGVRSLAARNPYQPFGVPASTDLYAVRGALPASSSLINSMAADFTSDAPALRLTAPVSNSTAQLDMPLAAGSPTCLIARVRPRLEYAVSEWSVGFAQAGAGQIAGLTLFSNGGFYTIAGGAVVNGPYSWAGGQFPGPWLFVQVFYDGTHYHYMVSADGVLWDVVPDVPASTAPTGVRVRASTAATGSPACWLDFVQQGTFQVGA